MTEVKSRQRLSINVDSLLPGKAITIGDSNIKIRPMVLEVLDDVTESFQALVGVLKEKEITLENCEDPENMLKIAGVVLRQFPELLEKASDIHIDDLKQLPPHIILEVINTVVDVNLEAKESLMGNWMSLIGKFAEVKSPSKKKKILKSK